MASTGNYYGCTVASQKATSELVNFNFGTQEIEDGQWGTEDLASYGSQNYFVSNNQIIQAVETYMSAWYTYCPTRNSGHTLNVMINTNNSANFRAFISDGSGIV
jgi:hypothetical protein